MFEELFERKIFNLKKALMFGFAECADRYICTTDILDGAFSLGVSVSLGGKVDTALTEKETGEEYTLYRTNAGGLFVSQVREAVEAFLAQVAENCFDTDVFKSAQAKEVISYVQGRYGDEPEYLWKKFPDNAVWRRKDTAKWYGAILTVSKSKLGLDSADAAEIIDLRIEPENMEMLLSREGYYPGWHMNKKHWYTVILDYSISTEEICRHIDKSYQLAL